MRALHGVPERRRAWAGVEAPPRLGRSAASEGTVGDVRLAKTPSRWARYHRRGSSRAKDHLTACVCVCVFAFEVYYMYVCVFLCVCVKFIT